MSFEGLYQGNIIQRISSVKKSSIKLVEYSSWNMIRIIATKTRILIQKNLYKIKFYWRIKINPLKCSFVRIWYDLKSNLPYMGIAVIPSEHMFKNTNLINTIYGGVGP